MTSARGAMVWDRGWREAVWGTIAATTTEPWDLIVVGGGITGAGIYRQAVHRGLRTLLLEARDFAWGTSSRSSKLIHGGLRYLAQGQWRMTRECVHERERLMREAPGLVEPVRFVRGMYGAERFLRPVFAGFFTIIDAFAHRRTRRHHTAAELRAMLPDIATERLAGAYSYEDAQTDDARLVLRLLLEGTRGGGFALSYARVDSLLLEEGRVAGVRVRDAESGGVAEVRSRVVVNAAGPAADMLRGAVASSPMMRPLRGSHLLFSDERFPLPLAVAWQHPADGRNVFAVPWEGSVLVGTTDVDHHEPPELEPRITAGEVAYLLEAVRAQFPSLGLARSDVVSTWAGVRPVIGGHASDPSHESRESAIVDEGGLVTVAGGKLTTFAATAEQALARVLARSERGSSLRPGAARIFDDVSAEIVRHPDLDDETARRLAGRYGTAAGALVAAAQPGELGRLPGTRTLWAELRWAARAEGVVHLEDLLLRRVRVGILLREGGAPLLGQVRRVCQPELGWSDARWTEEEAGYRALWRDAHAPPPVASVVRQPAHA